MTQGGRGGSCEDIQQVIHRVQRCWKVVCKGCSLICNMLTTMPIWRGGGGALTF